MGYKLPQIKEVGRFARELTAGMEARACFDMITKWAGKNIAYDYVKAAKVAKLRGINPDPLTCWISHRGICQDIASLTVIMLRAVGIQAYLCIGHADGNYHAWVQAYISGKVYRYDHDGKAKVYRLERKY